MMQTSIPEMDETRATFTDDSDEMETMDPGFRRRSKDEELYRIYPIHSNDTEMIHGEMDEDEDDDDDDDDIGGDEIELEQLKRIENVETGDVGWEEYT